MYKRFLGTFILIAGISMSVISVHSASAVNVLNGPCSGSASGSAVCQDSQATQQGGNPIYGPSGVITEVVNILSLIVGVTAIIMIIISGLRMVLSGGNSSSTNSARSALIVALVGLLIAAFAQALVAFVLNRI